MIDPPHPPPPIFAMDIDDENYGLLITFASRTLHIILLHLSSPRHDVICLCPAVLIFRGVDRAPDFNHPLKNVVNKFGQ